MPCNFISSSTPFRRRLDLFLRLSSLRSGGCLHPGNFSNFVVPMIFIIFDNYAYELGVKTVLAGILALLLGLVGFVISIFALGVFWIVPAMRTQIPPYRDPNHRRHPLHRSLNRPRGPEFTSSPEPMLQELPPIPLPSKTPSLRRAASFPDLQKTPSPNERPPVTSRHVSFNLDAPESYNPSLARSASMNPSPIPPPIQRRWPPALSPFSRRKSTQGESAPSLPTVRDESNTIMCNYNSPTSKSTHIHDLPLKCFDERCECHGRQNSTGCDEHGVLNQPQVDSLSDGTASTRSPKVMSLRLPSVRRAFSGKRRPASVPPRTPVVINVSAKEQSPERQPAPGSPTKSLPSPPPFSISGEMYRAEYVNPFRTKKRKKLEASNSSRNPRFSFSGPWSSLQPAGLTPDLAHSSASSSSVFTNSPSALRRTFASRFAPLFKSSAIDSPSSLEFSSPPPSPQLQVDVPKLTGKWSSRSVPRTQPYGPPWNAVMPGLRHDLVNESLDDVLMKRPRGRSEGNESRRGFKSPSRTLSPIEASEGESPPETLVGELDQRLLGLQHSQETVSGASAQVAQRTPQKALTSVGEPEGRESATLWTIAGLEQAVGMPSDEYS